jgi:hypothetical protein
MSLGEPDMNMNRSSISALLVLLIATSATQLLGQARIVSRDSTISIELPRSFAPIYINTEAELQFGDTATQSFVVVFPEGKRDLVGWNITRHSIITVARLLTGVADPKVTGPISSNIGGHPAVQYSIQGAAEGVRIAYLHTTIEAPDQFVQLIIWTTESRWAQNKSMLEAMASSVRVVPRNPKLSVDPFDIVYGTWAWEHENEEPCSALKQTFIISDNRKSMQIHHTPPIEDEDGSKISMTPYVIEGSSPRMLNTFIPTETRLTEDGKPVKWDLVVLARNRLAWHRADWPEGATTGMLRRCQ